MKKLYCCAVASTTNDSLVGLPDFSEPWKFSDVVLVVEDQKFHVHRSTLSIWSPVFETMFTSMFKEKNINEIPLPGKKAIDHFTVACSATWPLNGSEAGGDLVVIQTSLLLMCKSSYSNAN